MTFPWTFPFVFGQNRGIAFPITGWFPDLFVSPSAMALTMAIPAPAVVYPHLVAPPVMAVSMTAPSPVVDWVVSAPVMTSSDLISNPLVVFVIPAPAAVVTATVAAPALREVLSAPAMSVTATVPAPAITQTLVVSAPAMTATAVMPAPAMQQALPAPAMAVTAAIPAPTIFQTPSYDNSAKSAEQVSLASGTPFTFSSVGGSAGAYGIVFVSCTNANLPTLTGTTVSVTWGGVTMTSAGSKAQNNVSADGWGWVFVLPSVAAGGAGIPGGAQTISVTVTNSSSEAFTGYASSYSYANVSSAGTLQTAFGSGTAPTLTVSAANTTDIVWGAVAGHVSAYSAFSLTQRQAVTTPTFFAAGDTTGSTSVTVSATISTTVWAAFGLDLQ